MMNAIEIRKLYKHYPSFILSGIDLTLPPGCIMGFMGENGAGKSTTIKAMLGLIRPDSGSIRLLGRDHLDNEVKNEIGFVLDSGSFPEILNAAQIGRTLSALYKNWDTPVFEGHLSRFSIDPKKKIKEYSRGTLVKLSIAVALSHHCRLLIMDEPTSGLDPVVRDEILDLLLDFIQDEQHSVFLSSHITTDLEKVCDYITFIHQGRICLSAEKDTLLEEYGILKCGKKDFESIRPGLIYGSHKNSFGVEALVKRSEMDGMGFTVDPATLEEIMIFVVKDKEGDQ